MKLFAQKLWSATTELPFAQFDALMMSLGNGPGTALDEPAKPAEPAQPAQPAKPGAGASVRAGRARMERELELPIGWLGLPKHLQ